MTTNLNSVKSSIVKPFQHSTSERVVGKTIDNTDIYEKSYYLSGTFGSSAQSGGGQFIGLSNFNANSWTLVNAYGYIKTHLSTEIQTYPLNGRRLSSLSEDYAEFSMFSMGASLGVCFLANSYLAPNGKKYVAEVTIQYIKKTAIT